MRFFIAGQTHTVVVDDRFPYCPYRERWAFSRTSASNEIWVLLLEKAWAKIFGSYQRIEAGTTGEALQPLTGCPTKYYIHDENSDKEELW
jgi:calpain-15